MAAVDAQFYWMSAKIPNDQFLLYVFAGVPVDLDDAVDDVLARARACPDLAMRVDDGCAVTYPTWVPSRDHTDVARHELADDTWRGCLDAVARLADDQLDLRRSPWRLHVFTDVRNLPGRADPGTVAVLQVAHALADGSRASALAAWLFGRVVPVPELAQPSRGFLPWRAIDAARTHRRQRLGPRGRASCAPWCGAARSYPAPPSPPGYWPR